MTCSNIVPRTAAALSALLIGSCGTWFGDKVSCKETETVCDGDRVQECVSDPEASVSGGMPAFKWRTKQTCKDDPQLGRYTCGIVQGMATCVSEVAVDAGSSSEVSPEPVWLRVGVTRDSNGGMQIREVKQFVIEAMPADPAWGMAALVSYRGSDIVDATLVPFSGDAVGASAWLRGEDADRVELVDSAGTTLASVVRQRASSSVQGLARRDSALETHIPETLKISSRFVDKSRPVTPAMLQIVDQALARVPAELLVLLTDIVLALDGESQQVLAESSGSPDVDEPAMLAEDAEPSPLLGQSRAQRSIREGGRLWLDFRGRALREYQTDTAGLSFDIVTSLGGTYLEFSNAVIVVDMGPGGHERYQAPDFPPSLLDHLSDQHASLLAAKETISSAWNALQGVAVTARLSTPYQEVLSAPLPASDDLAVQAGFAAAEGAKSAPADLLSYLARANVPSLWASSPCDAIRAKPLDDLDPSLLVHVAKLLALRGLDLLSAEALERCAGKLRVSAAANAITLHKPNGERIAFADSLEGIRQPYFGREVQLSWKAERSYLGLSLSVGYRGPMPSIVRLAPVGGHEGKDGRMDDDYAAVFALTNPDGYQTGVAKGGLVVVSEVTPDVLEAYAVMVLLNKEQAGTTVFPLISARITSAKCQREDQERCSRLVWGDAP